MDNSKELLISLKQRVIDLENIINKPGVKKLIASYHPGDIEYIIKILGKDYNGKSGYDLFGELLKEQSKKKGKGFLKIFKRN